MSARILISLLFGTVLGSPIMGQFNFGSVNASAGIEDLFDMHGSLTPVSWALYTPGGFLPLFDNAASQNNQVCISGVGCGGVNGHTITGPFANAQIFTCGNAPGGLNHRPCGVTKYYMRPLCPAWRTWSAWATVSTRRGHPWGPARRTSNQGRTGCYVLPPPPPPTESCSQGSSVSEYVLLPLDGRVSVAQWNPIRPAGPLGRFETVAGQSFFVNEHVVAALDRSTGRYATIGSTDQGLATEALVNVELATPHRAYAPELVLALKVARHRGSDAYPLLVVFDEATGAVPGLPTKARSGDELEGLGRTEPVPHTEAPWRFAVALDIRDPLDVEREAEVLWSQRDVPAAWLDRLLASVRIVGNQGHRTMVYAVVEVAGPAMRVQWSEAVVPQCCCNGQLCN